MPRSAAARTNGPNGRPAPGVPGWEASGTPSEGPSTYTSSERPSGSSIRSGSGIMREVSLSARPAATRSRGDGGRELLEVRDVPLRVVLGVRDRQRPRLLLGPG